eukprot:scaffold456194_cov16-Prasinocladus_malaysianus.AAC.1
MIVRGCLLWIFCSDKESKARAFLKYLYRKYGPPRISKYRLSHQEGTGRYRAAMRHIPEEPDRTTSLQETTDISIMAMGT